MWPHMFERDSDGARKQLLEAAERLDGTQFYFPLTPRITLSKYGEARRMRELLLRIAKAAPGFRHPAAVSRPNGPEPASVPVRRRIRRATRIPLPFVLSFPVVRVGTDGQISVDEQRLLKYKPILDALHGLDASQIRQCPECEALFWACKSDKVVCSVACRGRRFRIESRDQYLIGQYRYEQSHPDRKRKSVTKEASSKSMADRHVVRSRSKRAPRLPGSSLPHPKSRLPTPL